METRPRRPRDLAFFALALALAASRAHAGPIDEIWIGVLAHDVSDIGRGKESGTADLLVELDSKPPSGLRFLGAPRLNAAVSLNSAGRSDLASVGLVWDPRLFSRLYGSFDLGLGLTNGLISPRSGSQGAEDFRHRLLLGSSVLFREAVGVQWRFNDRWALGASYVHASNASLLGAHRYNEGINDVGLKLGYRFP